jgi:hypothetical protein
MVIVVNIDFGLVIVADVKRLIPKEKKYKSYTIKYFDL